MEYALKKRKSALSTKRKITLIAAFIFACFVFIIIRLAKISITEHDKYTKKAISQHLRDSTILPKRGSIYDRNMNVFAESAACYTVAISPKRIVEANRDIIATNLSEILGVTYENIYDRFSEDTYYSEIMRNVDTPQIKQIEMFIAESFNQDKRIITGIDIRESSKRFYPNDEMASHIIGFVGRDGYGLCGLESYYDKELSGVPGRLITAQNGISSEMYYDERAEFYAKEGNSLVTTIDKVAQHYLETILENAVKEHNIQSHATGIFMDVSNGEILAMASKTQGGSYNLNDPFTIIDPRIISALEIMTNDDERYNTIVTALNEQWKNKAIADLYEPGSVFKVITASTALETNSASLSSQYYCNGSFKVTEEVTMRCAITAHGQETFAECLINSCNPGFIQIGQQIGRRNFYSYFKNFGFTAPTGIDLPGEAQSLYYTDDRMGIVELASVSYGQSNSITPIQMITAFAAVVNGGNLVQPHIVDRIMDSEGNIVYSFTEPVKRQVISNETSFEVRSILEKIINSQNSAYVAGYRLGGKSGTAEKLSAQSESLDGTRTFIASFCVFAPADNPKYILLLLFDEAKSHSIYGTTLVGPACALLMSDLLPYFGIEPTYTAEEMMRTDVGVPNIKGTLLSVAISELNKKGLNYEVVGEGTNVTLTTPQSGFAVPVGSTIYLYTTPEPVEEYVEMPDIIGESIQSATEVLRNLGINIRVQGTTEGWVVANKQTVAAGTEVAKGTVVTVNFIAGSATD
ncbi:MAG: penicillin-binding transpeptidase domain-containing protein [Oscillospiraceae bacterium]|nr:penicillin-binding transpeptidase domain-containing protein [Oscillospiraceae bacterium]